MNLVIVESPTKAKTISKFLGKDYKVDSSLGHVRDLPKSALGIDIEHDFQPKYVIPVRARKIINHLKILARKSKIVILATDKDREGEAIAWHLSQALDLDKAVRIVFHEITKSAIEEALQNPRTLDMNLVNAQQARRVLDRLVGYKLSPFLWKKVARGLSAGRVQSVAVRLVVERENEIRNFKSQEYWTIAAELLKIEKNDNELIEAKLVKIGDKTLEQFDVKTKDDADKIIKELEKENYVVAAITKKELRRNPLPPFTTSTLQQEAARRLGYSAKRTMFVAQKLYEEGHITYMRTDSVNLSKESVITAKNWLEKNLGEKYASEAPRFFTTKSKMAQEAHEAIRPTNVNIVGIEGNGLYQLIWQRFTASQMPQAIFDNTTIDINAGKYLLRASGNILRFDGYLKIWPQKFTEKELPAIEEKEKLGLKELKPEQHFTEPLPRYTEATLVKTLEEYGIGRPSTYAPIISVIQDRDYVFKEKGRFQPTPVGELVNKVLTEHFPEIIDITFTAKMENSLDAVAEGKEKWQDLIGSFYQPFIENLEKKYSEVGYQKLEKPKPEETGEICEKCGKPMVIRTGRFGKFMACSGFPECKNTKKLNSSGGGAAEKTSFAAKPIGMKCPKCNEGDVVIRFAKKGRRRLFYGCSLFPKCDFASWTKPQSP